MSLLGKQPGRVLSLLLLWGLLGVVQAQQGVVVAAKIDTGGAVLGQLIYQALSLMLWHRCSSLSVVDEQGLQVGVLQLDALLERPR